MQKFDLVFVDYGMYWLKNNPVLNFQDCFESLDAV